jgi:hypothetical protein
MLRFAKIFAFCLFCTFSTCYAQQYVVLKTDNFTAVGSGVAVRTIGTAMTSSRLAWNVSSGTLSACSVKAEQSATGTSGWSNFGSANACTLNGSGAFISGTPNFIRITLVTRTVATGTPTLTVTFTGWMVSAGGGTAQVGTAVVGGTTGEPLTVDGSINLAQTPAVLYADQFSGIDFCAKMTAAIAVLPATGGTVDARGFEGTQSCAGGTADGGKTVSILLGNTRISSAASPIVTLTGNGSGIEGVGASSLDQSQGTVLDHTGTGSAIQLGDTTAGVERIHISKLQIIGSASGAHGIMGWSRLGTFEKIIVTGYTQASGIGLELATSDANPNFLSYSNTCIDCEIYSSTTLVKLTHAAMNAGANNNHFIGGRYLGAFKTGFLIDSSSYTLISGAEIGNSVTNNAIGIDVQGTSTLTTVVGGLVEGLSGIGTIGIKTAAGTTNTRIDNTSLEGNATTYQDNSTDKTGNLWWQHALNEFPELLRIFTGAGGNKPCLRLYYTGDNSYDLCAEGGATFKFQAGAGGAGPFRVQSDWFSTTTNCADSVGAAACGTASAGAFVIDAATTSTVVSTTAVTANSQIFVNEDSSLGTRLGITCNTQSILVIGTPVVTARTAGASFTVSIIVGPSATPACFNYWIVN